MMGHQCSANDVVYLDFQKAFDRGLCGTVGGCRGLYGALLDVGDCRGCRGL